ncbi:pleckstrin homology domain-containing family A member 7 isoform X5 [Pelobates cultripes]|uniref:Pleckstrin homology domain-containing family A member 7 isoform X5 n=1 Tax=Pelobates cultripes TaxID=61616 RepID=A0AAD1TG35_PELCU|nr:pleckstrin homology domain-containing family A member 7 isoform X5 [Pelobates cultripes]
MWKPGNSSSLPRMDYSVYKVSGSHNQRATTFKHPVTGEISPENYEFDLREGEISLESPLPMSQRPSSMVSETSTAVTSSNADTRAIPKAPKSGNKVYSFGKREQSIKRNPDVPVVARGWLYKQDSSGIRLWKRRWFLLSDYCLFYYKDSREEAVLGSIPLPGYAISPVDPEDRINRKYSFKTVHNGMRAYIHQKRSTVGFHQENTGMRTYYFSADTQEDMNGWMKAMNQAAQMQSTQETRRGSEEMEWTVEPESNHIDLFREYSKSETIQLNNNDQKAQESHIDSFREYTKPEIVQANSYQKAKESHIGSFREYTKPEIVQANSYPKAKESHIDSFREYTKPEIVQTNSLQKAKESHIDSFREYTKPEIVQTNSLQKAKESRIDSFREYTKPEIVQTNSLQKAKESHIDSLREYTKPEIVQTNSIQKAKESHIDSFREYTKPEIVQTNRYQKAKESHIDSFREYTKPEIVQANRYQKAKESHIDSFREYTKPEIVQTNSHQKAKEPFPSNKFEDLRPELVEDRCTPRMLNSKGFPSNHFISNDGESAFTEFSKTYRSQVAQPQSFERNGTLPASYSMRVSPVEQNGMDKRGFVQRAVPEKQVQRRSNMAQVEQWVKIQKGDPNSVVSDRTLPRHNQPPHYTESYQTLPKTNRQPPASSPPPTRNLPSDYKYAHDRVNHFKMSNQERKATKEGMVWQLYEWQQRQQFKHGSPTGPINIISMDYMDRNRSKSFLDVPRSISVPPSPSDMPPPAPHKSFPPRRPHTPSERLTIRPEDVQQPDLVYDASSQKMRFHTVKSAAHVDRRSMPSLGYMTHTVSAPSLHGKSADDTYLQMKKDLEYLDLKVTGRESMKDRSSKPVRIAESDVDVKLSTLCEQDRILQDLEDKIRALKDNKDKLETVLEVLHRQMDQYKEQPQHSEKISYQQRLLQEDLVQIRAEMSKVSTDMENSWNEYMRLENDVSRLRQTLQEQMNRSSSSQEKTQMQKDLWRIEDVTAGLSSNKLNYRVLVESFKNPERKTVPLIPSQFVPSGNTAFTSLRSKSVSPPNHLSVIAKPTFELGLYAQPYSQTKSHSQPQLLLKSDPPPQPPTRVTATLEESAPPRPPLPDKYSPDDPDLPPNIPPPPAMPPPPRETSVIRHTSVRGLKRQSDERKRDRELGHGVNGDYRVELRTYLSDSELAAMAPDSSQSCEFLTSDSAYQTLPTRGLSGSTSRLPQSSSVASYVTLRRGTSTESSKDRPKSAFERLYYQEDQKGKMSAEEQLQRMKRHQKALVRERKRTLSQGDKQSMTTRPASRPLSADISSWQREQEFDLQLLERAARDVEDRDDSDWMKVKAVHVAELDMESDEYEFDISKELSVPDKVAIPERYIELEPEEPLSVEELEARHRKVQKIKTILARSSVHNRQSASFPEELGDMDSQWQEQERMITMSHALASEASQRSKQVAAHSVTNY